MSSGQGQGQRQRRWCEQGRSWGTVLGTHAVSQQPQPGDAVVFGGPRSIGRTSSPDICYPGVFFWSYGVCLHDASEGTSNPGLWQTQLGTHWCPLTEVLQQQHECWGAERGGCVACWWQPPFLGKPGQNQEWRWGERVGPDALAFLPHLGDMHWGHQREDGVPLSPQDLRCGSSG